MNAGLRLVMAMGLLSLICLFSCGDDSTDNGTGTGTGTGTGSGVARLAINVDGLGYTCSVYNLTTKQATKEAWQTGDVPNDVIAKNGKAYVVASVSNALQIVDLTTNKVTKNINLGANTNPWSIIMGNTGKVFVSLNLSNQLAVVDETSGVEKYVSTDKSPEGLATDGASIYVCCTGYVYPDFGQGRLDWIDAASYNKTRSMDLPTNPQGIVLYPTNKAYVVCTGNYADIWGKLVLVDLLDGTIASTIEVGGSPGIICYDSVTDKVFLGDMGANAIYVVKGATGQVLHGSGNPMLLCTQPAGLTVVGETGTLFVSSFDKNKVYMINIANESITSSYDVGNGPAAISIYRN